VSASEKVLEVPALLPMLPVRDFVFFPYMVQTIFVGRESSIKALEEALTSSRMILLVAQKDLAEESPAPQTIYRTGTVAMILRMRKLVDGRVRVLFQGVSKARIQDYVQNEPFFRVSIDSIPEKEFLGTPIDSEALIRHAREQVEKIIAHGRMMSPDILLPLDEITHPGVIAEKIAGNIALKVNEAQRVLELEDPLQRLKYVNELLDNLVDVLSIQAKIRTSAKEGMSKNQKEYFLREQLRAIKNELGEGDQKNDEIEDLREKLLNADMPKEVEPEALKQLARLERMHPDASEASMLRTYLDWLIELPWSIESEDNLDLGHARKVLDEDHFELNKIKERILEFLAVRKLKSNMKGPILCFAGPPGVGKTSLGKSIARAMGRKYHRIALGGVKDEAEIRGHRRTYVGAMPGKVIQALKQTKTRNPVFVLDEVDKLGSDFRGDPSAAMLEVLDPEQNNSFRDNYLNVDFDLSKVLFIATANDLSQIPQALRDRMEIIELTGYTEEEKIQIAKKHVIERQIEENGIRSDNIEFTDEGLRHIVSHYTREAGLRSLEREIGSVCRKVAKEVVLGKDQKYLIDEKMVENFLGVPKYIREDELGESRVGVATGLAWTPFGGEVLYIETLKMRGKGGLVMTGQLGDVMKESATAAMSYAKAHFDELQIADDWFEKNEVHVHIPAGATPKDGPSAGITLATALISLMTDTPVRSDVAMTGEITLTGKVLPIGGLRDKALAALRYGIKDIIIPIANQKDLADIPQTFRDRLNFIPVSHFDEVIAVALEKNPVAKKKVAGHSKDRKVTKIAAPAA